jgi:cytochrome c oxidase assembly protein subunit 15
MIFVMVLLGGATRLNHSGLSMVEWKPLTGILPPLTQDEWEATFHKYQQFPEFKKMNSDMDLEGFKSIFWLEYIHRIWGRAIGLVFFLPFLFFLLKGWVDKSLVPKLIIMFILGGLQGLLGWYMVMSGLVDHPDVSQYRLTAHLGLAFLVYAYIFWVALDLLWPRPCGPGSMRISNKEWWLAMGLFILVFITVLSGGFVAGTDAGFTYNTFPLMGDRLVPEGLFILEPPIRNMFENVTTVQFNHRLLAFTIFAFVVVLWTMQLKINLLPRTRLAAHFLLAAVVLQLILGISTLLLIVPVSLGIAHQAGALILLTSSLWTLHEFSFNPA